MRVVACALRPGVRLLLGAAEVDQVGSQTVELVLDLRERVGAERGTRPVPTACASFVGKPRETRTSHRSLRSDRGDSRCRLGAADLVQVAGAAVTDISEDEYA
jgi:hypothetical protein